jgi:hypothetical protein
LINEEKTVPGNVQVSAHASCVTGSENCIQMTLMNMDEATVEPLVLVTATWCDDPGLCLNSSFIRLQ